MRLDNVWIRNAHMEGLSQTWIHQIWQDTGKTASEAMQLAEDRRPMILVDTQNGGRLLIHAMRRPSILLLVYYYYYQKRLTDTASYTSQKRIHAI